MIIWLNWGDRSSFIDAIIVNIIKNSHNLLIYSPPLQTLLLCLSGYYSLHINTRIKSHGCFGFLSSLAFQWALKLCNYHQKWHGKFNFKRVGVQNHFLVFENLSKLGRSLQSQFTLSLFKIITKFQYALESWWQENSKTLPTLEKYNKLKVLEPSKTKPNFHEITCW